MRITDIRERSVPISRYADPALPSGGLDTSIVRIGTDAVRDGRQVIGYGFSSVGRFAQGGLIRDRFAPRLLAAAPSSLHDGAGRLDPFRAWTAMMVGEKRGGHGERCVAVGTLDMALWDIAAKLEGIPLHALLAARAGGTRPTETSVYAAGGYVYPTNDLQRLRDELTGFQDGGHVRAKIKIGTLTLDEDRRRVEVACDVFGTTNLAIDAMNAYAPCECLAAAAAFRSLGLMWFEDMCDPHDFETQARAAVVYHSPVAAGESLFSDAEARLLDRHGGLRRDRDVLVFDPVHCYGLPGYLRIVQAMQGSGWPRSAFWPHGGNLFCLHVAAGLGLGGAEVNPAAFAPFSGLPPAQAVDGGRVRLPDMPGVGFELLPELMAWFATLEA